MIGPQNILIIYNKKFVTNTKEYFYTSSKINLLNFI